MASVLETACIPGKDALSPSLPLHVSIIGYNFFPPCGCSFSFTFNARAFDCSPFGETRIPGTVVFVRSFVVFTSLYLSVISLRFHPFLVWGLCKHVFVFADKRVGSKFGHLVRLSVSGVCLSWLMPWGFHLLVCSTCM